MAVKHSKDFVVGLILMVTSILFYFYVIPEYVVEGNDLVGISPQFFPQLGVGIIGVMGFLISSTSVGLIFYTKKIDASGSNTFFRPISSFNKTSWEKPASVVVVVLIMCFLAYSFEHFGYIFSIPASLFLLMFVFRERSFSKLLLVSTFIPLVLYIVFNYGLNMPLE